MRRIGLWLGVALLAMGLVASACGGGDDETIDVGDGEITVGDDLPDGFPDDFPVYPGADVQGGYRGESEGNEGFFVTWTTGDSLDDVKAFYVEELEKDPWSLEGEFSSSGSVILNAVNASESQTAGVTIGEADGETTIGVFLGDDPSASSGDGGDEEPTPDEGDGGSDDEPTPDEGDGGSDGGDGTSGLSELPDEVDLHDDYPDEVPLPDDAHVTDSSSFSSGGTSTLFVQAYSEQSAEELADYFKGKLEDAGYAESFTSSSEGELFLSYTETTPDGVTQNAYVVTLTEDSGYEGYTSIAISLNLTAAQ